MPPEQNSTNHTDPVLQGIKDRSESYLSTIYALHGFILAVKQNATNQSDEVLSSIGRRMHYASGHQKRDFCTPDLVIQLQPSEGIVGEAKLLVCQNVDNHWNKYIKQLKRYDDDLLGWWTNDEQMEHTSLAWITELSFSSQVAEYFQSKIDSGEVEFKHPLAIIEFSKHQKAREFLFLRTRLGAMPSSMEKAFRDGIDVALETLIFENREKKFYDAKPQDTEYIMDILWQNIFTQEAINNQSGLVTYHLNDKIWRIPVALDTLTTTLQKLYGSVGAKKREVEYPQNSWIREALDKFVSIGFAEKGSTDKEYVILFRRLARPMEKFVNLIYKKKKKTQNEGKQLELFSSTAEEQD